MHADLAGKTVRLVTSLGDYDGIQITFTDGTALNIQGCGYEDSCVTTDLLDRDEARAHQRKAQGEREKARVGRLAEQQRNAEIKAARDSMSEQDFEEWMRKRLGPMGYAMRQTMLNTSTFASMLKGSSRYEVTTKGGSVKPTFEWSTITIEPSVLSDQ